MSLSSNTSINKYGNNKQNADSTGQSRYRELRTNARGVKYANVTHLSRKPVVIVTTVLLAAPFGARVYQGDGTETRLNIDFSMLEGIEPMLKHIYEQLIQAETAPRIRCGPARGSPVRKCVRVTSALSERGRAIPRHCAAK